MNQHQQTIDRIYRLLAACPNPDKREDPAGWSVKEIVGHLLDSLSNNHQRLSRYNPNGHLAFPGYEQTLFVQRAHYATFDFKTLLALWFNYNQLLLHIIDHIPPEDIQSTLTIGQRPTLTIGQLITEYFDHMENHEQQLKRIINA